MVSPSRGDVFDGWIPCVAVILRVFILSRQKGGAYDPRRMTDAVLRLEVSSA
jgi:hypothetical protein